MAYDVDSTIDNNIRVIEKLIAQNYISTPFKISGVADKYNIYVKDLCAQTANVKKIETYETFCNVVSYVINM